MIRWISVFFDWITGKKPETPSERIVRLTNMAQTEEQRTKKLQEKLEEKRMITGLQDKILSERGAQQKLYEDLGVDSPQVQKQKRIRMLVILGIALIFIVVIARSCFK
jgi:hypothetical protein